MPIVSYFLGEHDKPRLHSTKCRSKFTFLLVYLGYQKKPILSFSLNFFLTTADFFNGLRGNQPKVVSQGFFPITRERTFYSFHLAFSLNLIVDVVNAPVNCRFVDGFESNDSKTKQLNWPKPKLSYSRDTGGSGTYVQTPNQLDPNNDLLEQLRWLNNLVLLKIFN